MKTRLIAFSLCVIFLVSTFGSSPAPVNAWAAKVDPWLLDQGQAMVTGEKIEFLVILHEQADLSGVQDSWSKAEKGQYVYELLTETASRTQGPVVSLLQSLGAETRPFWISNMIWARGSWSALQATATRTDVKRVTVNLQAREITPVLPATTLQNCAVGDLDPIQANLTAIHAPEVWAMGYTGQGVVVGGQDTGYQWDHPMLINSYRGWNGSSADHDYNWHDAIHVSNWACAADSPFPCDDNGHGTHTMGIAVGLDNPGRHIGVAPGAEWIGCRSRDEMHGSLATYAECFEWFMAPYPVGETPDQGDPAMAPDIINNSWECFTNPGDPDYECSQADVEALHTIVANVRLAGIFLAASAGNETEGSECGTVENPSAIYNEVFTVGATDNYFNIQGWSGRGPSTYDGLIKPDITAPGLDICSSVRNNGYMNWSGTSMAAPHVAGLAALLMSAAPSLKGQVDLVEEIIASTAVERTTTQNCGGVPGDQIPNNTYGWGAINALAAVNSIIELEPPVAGFEAPAQINLGETVDFVNTTEGTPPITYLWEFGDGATSTEVNPAHTYASAGTFTVRLTATNPLGSDDFSATITVLPAGPFDITAVELTQQTPAPIHPGDLVNIRAAFLPVYLTPPVSYSIAFGDGAVMDGTTNDNPLLFEHAFGPPGSYTVSIEAWNNDMQPGEAVSDQLTIEVVPEDPDPIDVQSIALTLVTTGTLLPGDNPSFLAVFGPENLTLPLWYALDFGDGTPVVTTTLESTSLSFEHVYQQAGTYPLQVRAWNNDMPPQQAVSAGLEVVIEPPPPGPVDIQSVTLVRDSSSPIYAGNPVDFTASFAPANLEMPVTYVVNYGDGSTSGQLSAAELFIAFSHTYAAQGSYTVVIHAWNNDMLPSEAVSDGLKITVLAPVVYDTWTYLPAIEH